MALINESILYAKKNGLKIRFTAEDASRTDLDYLLKIGQLVEKAGADRFGFADTVGVLYGGGKYLIRQGIGGKGFGLDLGVVSKEINGWTFGASMINVFGTIEWNKPSGMKDFLESYPEIFGGFYPF